MLSRLPKNIGETKKAQPRLLFRRRYWLYYVLLLFEGSRTQVFSAFNPMVLVYNYGLSALQISFLLLASSLVNFLLAQRLGRLLDIAGERITLTMGYVALALCFVGYATVHNVWFLGTMVICINLLVTLSMGLSTYVNRIAPSEELTPTLSTGVSVNHITSVGMSFRGRRPFADRRLQGPMLGGSCHRHAFGTIRSGNTYPFTPIRRRNYR